MKNSENKIKQTVTAKRNNKNSFEASFVTVLKTVINSNYITEKYFDKQNIELIDNIWFGTGSLALVELENNMSNKLPSHLK